MKLNKELSPDNVFAQYVEEVIALHSAKNVTFLCFKPNVFIDSIDEIIVIRKDINKTVKLYRYEYQGGTYTTVDEGLFCEADVGKTIRCIISAEHIFNNKEK